MTAASSVPSRQLLDHAQRMQKGRIARRHATMALQTSVAQQRAISSSRPRHLAATPAARRSWPPERHETAMMELLDDSARRAEKICRLIMRTTGTEAGADHWVRRHYGRAIICGHWAIDPARRVSPDGRRRLSIAGRRRGSRRPSRVTFEGTPPPSRTSRASTVQIARPTSTWTYMVHAIRWAERPCDDEPAGLPIGLARAGVRGTYGQGWDGTKSCRVWRLVLVRFLYCAGCARQRLGGGRASARFRLATARSLGCATSHSRTGGVADPARRPHLNGDRAGALASYGACVGWI